MPRKIRQLKALLRHAGFIEGPGKGSHRNFSHPLVSQTHLTISGNDGDDAQRYHEQLVAKKIALVERTLKSGDTP